MKRIGLLSDTHAYWDARYTKYFSECDEIWHAGDIGSMDIITQLEEICPVRAVTGNIDGGELCRCFPKVLRWQCEEADVMMTHIGGYPRHYAPKALQHIHASRPKIFIAGHSHILKVIYDPVYDLLHINPGAAGKQGWQLQRTLVKVTIDGNTFKDLEIIELA